MEALLKVSTPLKFQKGAKICSFEDDMGLMYILVNGKVGVKIEEPGTNNEYDVLSVDQGEFFGGLGLVKGRNRVMEAIAMEPCVILETSLDRLDEYKKENPDGAKLYIDLMKRSHGFTQKVNSVVKVVAEGDESQQDLGKKFKMVKVTEDQMAKLMMKSFHCPICGESFKSLGIRESKVKSTGRGDFFMNEYEGIDPLWFEVILCPKCAYAERTAQFNAQIKYNTDLIKQYMMSLQMEQPIKYSEFRTANEVYQAFLRYEHCLDIKKVDEKVKAKAKLVIYEFLSRLGNDEKAVEYRDQAFEFYRGMFGSGILDVDDAQLQQLYLIIGKLFEHRGEYKEAKDQFRNAKMLRGNVDQKFTDLAEEYLIDLDMKMKETE